MERQLEEVSDHSKLVAGPIVCPICWDHALEKLEGVQLTARTLMRQNVVNRGAMYRCSSWHVFAVFEQHL